MNWIPKKMKFKFNTIATNKNGTLIFCKLKTNDNKIILKGYQNFNINKFIVTKYYYNNFPINYNKTKIKTILKNILLTDYDWNL